MLHAQPAPVPDTRSLSVLKQAARGCQACDLFRNATQTVFGEGSTHARIVAVGEQPGDQEDIQGRPFVGPAGKLLARALEQAGIDPAQVYITNAVKHFKFEERGKRRIHQKPNNIEIQACRPWLAAEIASVKPELILCLGATAAQSLLSKKVTISEHRGKFLTHPWARIYSLRRTLLRSCASCLRIGNGNLAVLSGILKQSEIGSSRSTLNLRLRVALSHPLDELFGSCHGREPSLPHQRPILEFFRLLDFCERGGRFQMAAELEVHHRRFRILGVRPGLRTHYRHPDHAGGATAAMINEYPVAGTHFPDGPHGLRVGHTVPGGFPFALQITYRVSFGICLGQEVIHSRYAPCRYPRLRYTGNWIPWGNVLISIVATGTAPGPKGRGLKLYNKMTCRKRSRRIEEHLTVARRSTIALLSLTILMSGVGMAQSKPPQTPPPPEKVEAPKVNPGTPNPDATALPIDPKSYVIGPEDVLYVKVWRENDFTGLVGVRPDGKITLSLIGDVQAAGLTPEGLSQQLKQSLSQYINKPDVTVTVAQVNSKRFTIMGEVNRPGVFPLVVKIQVFDALGLGGGFKEFANKKDIVIIRGSQRIKFNWTEVVKGKKLEQNIFLENGDIVLVK